MEKRNRCSARQRAVRGPRRRARERTRAARVSPEWSMLDAAAPREAPELLATIHRAYLEAGADVIRAFTARSTVRTLAKGGLGMRAAALTNRAVDALRVSRKLQDPADPWPSRRAVVTRRSAATGTNAIGTNAGGRTRRTGDAATSDRLRSHPDREAMPTVRETLAATAAAHAVMPGRVDDVRADRTDASRRWRGARRCGVVLGRGRCQAVLIGSGSTPDLLGAISTLAGLALGVPLGAQSIQKRARARR